MLKIPGMVRAPPHVVSPSRRPAQVSLHGGPMAVRGHKRKAGLMCTITSAASACVMFVYIQQPKGRIVKSRNRMEK